MKPDDIEMIRHCMPEATDFPYYTDRESAWLLAHACNEKTKVAALRKGPFGKLLSRPAVAPVIARSGGTISRGDLWPVGCSNHWTNTCASPAAQAGLEAVSQLPWHEYELSFGSWGIDTDYRFEQMSRMGGNLVLQLGFPKEHSFLLGNLLGRGARREFEYTDHPVRLKGRPTLAWARLDIELTTGTALIEEIQSDWLRNASYNVDKATRERLRGEKLERLQIYEREIRQTYGKIWSKAMMLTVLWFLVDELGCNDIWMHKPHTGVVLKNIPENAPPPRSLYTNLPKAFCFQSTREVPLFLKRSRRKDFLDRARKKSHELFWRLTF